MRRITQHAVLLCLLFQLVALPAFAEKNLSADVVVIGGGGSGIVAAYAVAQGGAQSVIVLEKQPAIGGTAKYAEGIFAADSKIQQERNILLPKDDAFKMIMNYSHWRANAKLVRAFVDKSPETIEWLQTQGVEFAELTSNYPGGLQSWHIFNGRGKGMLDVLTQKFPEMNIQIMTETPGKDLIIKDGVVAGVVAENRDGETLNIHAKAVIVATGGFLNNKEMMSKYTRFPDVIPVGNVGKTGDGIQMMLSADAATEGMEVVQSYRPGLSGEPTTSHLLASVRQPYLWVDTKGERFCDEMVIFQWPFAGNALERSGGLMFAIYDANTKKYMIEDGIDVGVGVMVPVKTKLANLDKDLQRGIANNVAFTADTIEGLAEKMGAPIDNLKETIELYNSFAQQKHDGQFAKDPKYLRAVVTPPFFAVEARPMALGTLGGAKVTQDMQVLSTQGNVIPGLYAVGNDAGGMYGDSYDLLMAGSTIGFAVNSGRMAAEHAAEYIKTVQQ
ncbi:FAD-dependent oxidoreductase [Desulfofustis glycolicus]|uniref:Fumarate reductase flavoprotein subunit n=1 Tax=Desulfofustis glycolicus DSM 9705 TaxID=1121409 RepID=A0A1M5YCL2_9BACT|nr:FAD-dependent oxidoreductase [Desulfofustis glycolicus]MCB2217760.1 FAD-dependent oxidoreductase [Desulfobulbaceae bacterium]SHI09568.1 fumarate reductase flavoprotein subunit [Desulfofustis glycolicus DSM 9705]